MEKDRSIEKKQQPAGGAVRSCVPGAVIMALVLLASFILTYKAQMIDLISGSVKATLYSLHKGADRFDVVLDADQPAFTQTFLCPFPEVKTLSISADG